MERHYSRQEVIDAFTTWASDKKIHINFVDFAEFTKKLDARIQPEPVDVCEWKYENHGMFGDSIYATTCGKTYDADTTDRTKYCPNCGKLTK